jgi:hypothetical protein
MLGYSLLLNSDLSISLAIPSRLSPRGIERVTHLAILVVRTSLVVAEHRRYSLGVARRSG